VAAPLAAVSDQHGFTSGNFQNAALNSSASQTGARDQQRAMFRINSAKFSGYSGRHYTFYAYSIDHRFEKIGAVYTVTRRYKNNHGGASHHVLYIDQTDDLSAIFASHSRWDCFIQRRANCLCTHVDPDQESRSEKMRDLIRQYRPECNQ
jgi:hypothetical protein